jgi:hypothetical protein
MAGAWFIMMPPLVGSHSRSNMQRKFPDRHTGLNLISAIILLVGLGSAILIYQRAENDSNRVLGYEERDGSLYPIMPEDSKQYLRDLELYGGKANVLADEFRRWFVGLWQGKSLAFILACTTIFISFGVFYAANYLTPRLTSEVRAENHQDGTD